MTTGRMQTLGIKPRTPWAWSSHHYTHYIYWPVGVAGLLPVGPRLCGLLLRTHSSLWSGGLELHGFHVSLSLLLLLLLLLLHWSHVLTHTLYHLHTHVLTHTLHHLHTAAVLLLLLSVGLQILPVVKLTDSVISRHTFIIRGNKLIFPFCTRNKMYLLLQQKHNKSWKFSYESSLKPKFHFWD